MNELEQLVDLAVAMAKVLDMTSCCKWRPYTGAEVFKAMEVTVSEEQLQQ